MSHAYLKKENFCYQLEVVPWWSAQHGHENTLIASAIAPHTLQSFLVSLPAVVQDTCTAHPIASWLSSKPTLMAQQLVKRKLSSLQLRSGVQGTVDLWKPFYIIWISNPPWGWKIEENPIQHVLSMLWLWIEIAGHKNLNNVDSKLAEFLWNIYQRIPSGFEKRPL